MSNPETNVKIETLISSEGLEKYFSMPGERLEILKGVDLGIRQGEFSFIVGKSGSGKSTLLHILGGLDTPSAGKVICDGVDLFKLSERELARFRNQTFGFVFQFFHLLPELTLLENVLLPSLIKGHKATHRAAQLIDQVGLKDRLKHYPSQLSGGEQQRVALARALINNPKAVFCDEPTGNLDEETAGEMKGLMTGLNRDGVTFLTVTHDEELAKGASSVYHLHNGTITRSTP
jgi:lipoprotein-releasing system ATP-binding protein